MPGPGRDAQADEVAPHDQGLDRLPVDPELLELPDEPAGLAVQAPDEPLPPAGPVGRVEVDHELDLPLEVGRQPVEGLFRDGLPVLPRARPPGDGSG